MLGTAQRSRAVGKCPAFPVQDGTFATQANDGRITRGTVGLLAYFDRRHERKFGET